MSHRLARKRERAAVTALLLCFLFVTPSVGADTMCKSIVDGTIHDEEGNLVTPGPNGWGYDYDEHLFLGGYCGSTHDAPSCEPYRDVELVMIWNDAWLANTDCDGDGLLDRHRGTPSYRGSGAELVNAMHGRFEQGGVACDWYQVQRFLAAPLEATRHNGSWVASDGSVLGEVSWNDFYVVDSQYNEVCLEQEPASEP